LSIGLDQTDSVPVAFAPGQIDPHHQHSPTTSQPILPAQATAL
jgi:hypothetical protein